MNTHPIRSRPFSPYSKLGPASSAKRVCRVCGEAEGTCHDKRKCTEEWIRRCDAERTQGNPPADPQ